MSSARRDALFPTLAADAVALLMRMLGWMGVVWGPVIILVEFALAPPETLDVPGTPVGFVVFWAVGAVQVVLVGLLLLWLSAGILHRHFRRSVFAAMLITLFALGSLAAALLVDGLALAPRVAAAVWGVTMVGFGAVVGWEAALRRGAGRADEHR